MIAKFAAVPQAVIQSSIPGMKIGIDGATVYLRAAWTGRRDRLKDRGPGYRSDQRSIAI